MPCTSIRWLAVLLLTTGTPLVAQPVPTGQPDPVPVLTREQVEAIVAQALETREKQPACPPEAKTVAEPESKASDFRAFWQDGLRFETKDKEFRLHLGGIIHTDFGWFTSDEAVTTGPDGVGPIADGANFRRARLHAYGSMYDTVNWALEVGFENRLPQLFNAYGELPQLPYLGTWRIGHFREPFGLDALTGYNNLTFLERGLVLEPFDPFFNLGTMLFGTWFDQTMTYAGGVFRSDSDSFNAAGFGDGNYAYTGRLTCNPWYQEDAAALHLGVAGSYRVLPELDAQGEPVASGGTRGIVLGDRPEIRVGLPKFASTGVIPANREQLLGAELGLSLGPFLLQAEYSAAFLGNAALPGGQRGTAFFSGYYVQASTFLTGEHRPYVRTEGVFGTVRPRQNFFWVQAEDGKMGCGLGAWEAGIRYSAVDLDNRGINGGQLRDLTLGLNWYLNPSCRFCWNYLLIWRNNTGASDGLTQALGARFQIEF